MGGQVGFGMARLARDRLVSLTIDGNHPYERDAEESAGMIAFLGEDDGQPLAAFLAGIESAIGRLPEAARKGILENDPRALIALAKAASATGGLDEGLGLMDCPALVIAGDQAPEHQLAKKAAAALPNARFVSLAGFDHMRASVEAETVLPIVLDFLRSAAPTGGVE